RERDRHSFLHDALPISGSAISGRVRRPDASNSRGENRPSFAKSNSAKNPSRIFPCMSAAIACTDFLQTSGNRPASLTMPPFWPRSEEHTSELQSREKLV